MAEWLEEAKEELMAARMSDSFHRSNMDFSKWAGKYGDRLIAIAEGDGWIMPHDAYIRPSSQFVYCVKCGVLEVDGHKTDCPFHPEWRKE